MRAVVLDRDGVINDHRNYVNTPDDFILYPEAPAAIRRLNESGFFVGVATNQGGVGLGYSTLDNLHAVHEKMRRQLSEAGADLDDIAVCTHKPHAGCSCRKPRPGMLFDLRDRHQLLLSQSYMVGDRETDVEAGRAAGMRTVLIARGMDQNHRDFGANYVAADLQDAVNWILRDSMTP